MAPAETNPDQITGIFIVERIKEGPLPGLRCLSWMLFIPSSAVSLILGLQLNDFYLPYFITSLIVAVLSGAALAILHKAIKPLGRCHPVRGLVSSKPGTPVHGTCSIDLATFPKPGSFAYGVTECVTQPTRINITLSCKRYPFPFTPPYVIVGVSATASKGSTEQPLLDLTYDPEVPYPKYVDINTIVNGKSKSARAEASTLVETFEQVLQVFKSLFPIAQLSGTFVYHVAKSNARSNSLMFGVLGAVASEITDFARERQAKRQFIDGEITGANGKRFSDILAEHDFDVKIL